jgi:transposase
LLEKLQRDLISLSFEVSAVRVENAALKQDNAALKQEVVFLKVENAELRRRLDLDSSNSGKPPSSDGLAKKTRKPRIAGSLRGLMGSEKKASGGQVGHKGDTLRVVAEPDKALDHHAGQCGHCPAPLTAQMRVGIDKRQVFDLPEPHLEVTEHRASVYRCACCGEVTRAAFPEGVSGPVQYGPRIKAAAVYLNVQHLIPEDRVSELLCDMLGAGKLCPASIAAWCGKAAQRLEAFTAHVAAQVAKAPVRNLDETGFRVAGKLHWLHTASTPALTAYRVSEKRGDVPTDLKGGVIVHDHFKSYFALSGLDHALCNAHHLRELKALIEIEKEPWAKRMFRLLLAAHRAVQRAKKKGHAVLAQRVLRRITALYGAILDQGLTFHRAQPSLTRKSPNARGRAPKRIGHNLLVRFRDFMGDVLRFAYDFTVPFTNNLAEQDIRMTKVRMKISGAFRTITGAQVFAALRAVLSTARKQGWNPLLALQTNPDHLIAALLT